MARKWQICTLSNGELDRAGIDLAKGFEDDILRYLDAYEKMDRFRRSHAFPLNTLQMTLRQRAKRVSSRAVVAQRLKRSESIISKIQRQKSMKLSRMQDIGGCRAIMPSVSDVRRIIQLYDVARDRHIHTGYKDYITDPRPSGYRGYHII
jgi:(p)ppGpp synthase/HD superfamily hydrolase